MATAAAAKTRPAGNGENSMPPTNPVNDLAVMASEETLYRGELMSVHAAAAAFIQEAPEPAGIPEATREYIAAALDEIGRRVSARPAAPAPYECDEPGPFTRMVHKQLAGINATARAGRFDEIVAEFRSKFCQPHGIIAGATEPWGTDGVKLIMPDGYVTLQRNGNISLNPPSRRRQPQC